MMNGLGLRYMGRGEIEIEIALTTCELFCGHDLILTMTLRVNMLVAEMTPAQDLPKAVH